MGNKIKKVIYIITLPDVGGAQVHLYELITNLPSNIASYLIVGDEGWLTEKLQKTTCNVFILKSIMREISPINDIRAVVDIQNIIQKIQPDIVHCHSSKAGFVGRIAAKLCGVPAIFTAHGWAFTEGVSQKKQYAYKNIEKMIAKWTRKIICVSEYDRELALKAMPKYKNKLVTIHNGIPIKNIYRQNDDNRFNLVMIARFSPPKNQQAVIKAFNKLCEEGLKIHLTFVGDGPNFMLVKQLANQLNLSKNIEFLGTRTDIEEILSKQDIFLLISNWEGFPISVLEAMRSGLPVIASDVGGVRESVIDGVNGFLIPREDIDYLVEKIKYFYFNQSQITFMGLQGKKKFEECFTTSVMMKKILKIYDEILIKK